MITNAYVDGASTGEWGPGGWGVIIEGKRFPIGSVYYTEHGGEEWTTNQRMEIMAAIMAIRHVEALDVMGMILAPTRLVIHSDAAYLVNCMNRRWFDKWLRNGWKNAAKKDVANPDLWKRLLVAMDLAKFPVEFKKVKGYKPTKRNPKPNNGPQAMHYKADRLAVMGKKHAIKRVKEQINSG
jgi:ribonuclease HI